MSLWDWGIFRTNQQLQDRLKNADAAFKGKYFHSYAEYDWNEDRIKLYVQFTGEGPNATDDACISHIKNAKSLFLDYSFELKEQIEAAPRVMGSLFSHAGGYEAKNQPKDVATQLVGITIMEVTMLSPSGNGFTPRSKCSSGLVSSTVNVVKK